MRLLFISNVFPSPLLPTVGPFNRELVRALSWDHEVRVVCPVAWTDEWKARRAGRSLPKGRVGPLEGARNVTVRYPRYWFTPRVLRQQYGRFMWRSLRRGVMEELSALRPDAVVGYWAHPDGEVAVRAARIAGVPSAVMVGGSDVLVLASDCRRRERIVSVLKAADVVIPVSEDLRQKLVSLGVPRERIHVVPRGVDTDQFSPGDAAAARRRLGVAPAAPMLLWVGRMHHVKGLDVLVDACALLGSRGTAFHLYLVGHGPERDGLRRQVESSGLSESITFVGPVAHAELGDWYRAADLMVLPSRSEGIPNVLRESLACGTPFVASRVGGIPEIAPSSCRLVPPDDSGMLADAIVASIASGGRPAHPIPTSVKSWGECANSLVRVLSATGAGRGAGTLVTPRVFTGAAAR